MQRAHPAAAYLLTALLGAATPSAGSPSGEEAESGALFAPEEAGVAPDEPVATDLGVEGGEEALLDEGGRGFQVTMGVLAFDPESLPELFARTPVVVLATVGGGRLLEQGPGAEDDEWFAESELEIDGLLRGRVAGDRILLRYPAFPLADIEAEGTEESGDPTYAEGTTLLAFLEPAESSGTGGAAWQSIREPQVLDEGGAAAYRSRLEALAELLPEEASGEISPDLLAEWYVGTIESVETRSEGIHELGESELSPEQRDRLTAALVATDRFTDDDLTLFSRVWDWAPSEAEAWLRRGLLDTAYASLDAGLGPDEAMSRLLLLERGVGLLEDEELEARSEAATAKVYGLFEELYAAAEEEKAARQAFIDGEIVRLTSDLAREIAAALESPEAPALR